MKKIFSAFIMLLSAAPAIHSDVVATTTIATVIEVVDVGTLRVDYNGFEERLRLIGVVAPPESGADKDVSGASSANNDAGWSRQKASDGARALVNPGDKISLEFDVEPRDMENNLLAYVFFQDNLNNTVMLNNAVIFQGYADTKAVPPNVKYAGILERSCEDAMRHFRGLWQYRTNESGAAGEPSGQ